MDNFSRAFKTKNLKDMEVKKSEHASFTKTEVLSPKSHSRGLARVKKYG